MNRIKVGDFRDSKKKKLYQYMLWGADGFAFQVEPTIFRGHPSLNSYTLAGTRKNTREELIGQFQIEDPEQFREKFDMSCGGSGQEGSRIATLHSSALCALLFFYRVSPEHPCRLLIEEKWYTFTHVRFEYQNPVIEHPSNIDVALLGVEEDSDEPVVLFLESKFAEYYLSSGRTSNEISTAYQKHAYGKAIYADTCLDKLGLKAEPRVSRKGDECFVLRTKDGKTCYLDGLKQMVSHYIGVRKRVDDPFCEPQEEGDAVIANAIAKGAKVLLGEILFPLFQPKKEGEDDCHGPYQKKYQTLADILNAQLKKDGQDGKITVLKELLFYDQVYQEEGGLEDKIRQFYFSWRQV